MAEIIARRQFDPLFIWLVIAFLLVFAALLIFKKKYMTLIIGVLSGILYMVVDFGLFHLVFQSREIFNGYSLFWVLLWMSMSYGFTNFVWIWLWISKDKRLFEWTLLILAWWVCNPMIANTFGGYADPVIIQRTTGSYHGYMALIMFAGYLGLIIWNLTQKDKKRRINIPWLLAIGILVQFGWEAGLLIGGIRSAGFASMSDKLMTTVVNSLVETNLGMPYIYLIFIVYSKKFKENLQRRKNPVSFMQRIEENNDEKVKGDTISCEYLA